ncbi:MAG: restriction endonuclease subunit M [Bacteroidaceae bacterium]|nr:restriction endonuclease subunit M [Bacteroidaceae bacterium]
MPFSDIDIRENELWQTMPEVLEVLLRDHTTQRNILWCTHDYESLGDGYGYAQEILPQLITGERGDIIRPRVLKSKEQQTDRAKDMAEVFTPSWICNAQNNLVDDALPDDMKWKDYVRLNCLEITCGEAPYLVSRYDTTTGKPIPLSERIGLLDRKLRLVSENTKTSGEWSEWAQIAYMNTYGYEWQGDNLLLARETQLISFIEYYQAKFGKVPTKKNILCIADIISWNLWQMDGLKGVVPDSCKNGVIEIVPSLFDDLEQRIDCMGCQLDDIRRHNGTYCMIRDWENDKELRFVDLIK